MDRLRDELSHYFEPTRFASTSKMKPSHQRINVGPSPRVRAAKNPPDPNRITELGNGFSPTSFESDHLQNCAECLRVYRETLQATIDRRAKINRPKPR